MKIPCENCICKPICRQRVIEIGFIRLCISCSIVDEIVFGDPFIRTNASEFNDLIIKIQQTLRNGDP